MRQKYSQMLYVLCVHSLVIIMSVYCYTFLMTNLNKSNETLHNVTAFTIGGVYHMYTVYTYEQKYFNKFYRFRHHLLAS
jgi:hypothetical protein